MSLEKKKEENQKVWLMDLLTEEHKDKLSQILAIGEENKELGEFKEKEFWNNFGYREFKILLQDYENNKKEFEERLFKERKILGGLGDYEKEKFYEEYLYKLVLYSGNFDNKIVDPYLESRVQKWDVEGFKKWVADVRDSFKPNMTVDISSRYVGDEGAKALAEAWRNKLKPGMDIVLWQNDIGNEGVKAMVEAWKNDLQPGIKIELNNNKIGDEGIKVIAEGRKNNLQPGMGVNLDFNRFGEKGVKALVEAWKGKLQPGMRINLDNCRIGDKLAEIIAKGWKDSLQPGMSIHLGYCSIGDDGVEIIAKEWKDKLQPGMFIGLYFNGIGDAGIDHFMNNWELKEGMRLSFCRETISEGKISDLEKWVQGFKNKGINCDVSLL